MFSHDNVGEESEATRATRLIQRLAGNALKGVSLKHSKAIPGYRGDEEAGAILVDSCHDGWAQTGVRRLIRAGMDGPVSNPAATWRLLGRTGR